MSGVVAFTGTNTGKVYEVGKVYVTGAGVAKVAQADGTFKPLAGQSGVSHTVGSSKSSSVTFIVADNNNKKIAVKGNKIPGAPPSSRVASALVVELADQPRYSGVGSGNKAVAQSTGGAGFGSGAGAVPPSGWLSFVAPDYPYSIEDQTIHLEDRKEGITIPMWMGIPMVPLPWVTSDAGDLEQAMGESEFGSVTWMMNNVQSAARFAYSIGVAAAKQYDPASAVYGNAQQAGALASQGGLGVVTPGFQGGQLMGPLSTNGQPKGGGW